MFDSRRDWGHRGRAHRSLRVGLGKVSFHAKPGTPEGGSLAFLSSLFIPVGGRGVLGTSYGVPQAQGMRPEARHAPSQFK